MLIPWVQIATNAVNRLVNLCYGSALPVERQIATKILWRDSVRRLAAVNPHTD